MLLAAVKNMKLCQAFYKSTPNKWSNKKPKTKFHPLKLPYLVVLGGDRWRWWGHFRLALGISVVSGGVGGLVPPISCRISRSRDSNGCRSGYSDGGSCGGEGCSYSVSSHWSLMHGVACHCGRMSVGYSSGRLLTTRQKRQNFSNYIL